MSTVAIGTVASARWVTWEIRRPTQPFQRLSAPWFSLHNSSFINETVNKASQIQKKVRFIPANLED
jgi:hypothetical protein